MKSHFAKFTESFVYKRSVMRRQLMFRYKSKYKKVGVLPIWKVKSNVSSVGPSSESSMMSFVYTWSQLRNEMKCWSIDCRHPKLCSIHIFVDYSILF